MKGGSRVRTLRELRVSLIFLAVVALLPLVVRVPYWLGVLIVSMYFAIVAAAWNLLAGYTGQFSLAPATFAMIGGYSSGLRDILRPQMVYLLDDGATMFMNNFS